MNKIIESLSVISAIILSGLAMTALADNYPQGDISLVVPFDPGGSVDTTSRIIAETANTILNGAKVVVKNHPGGGGVVGQTFAAHAKADGYTVLAMTSSVVTNPRMKGASYSVDDFKPVALYNLDPEVIVVPAISPFHTAEEFITAAKQRKVNIVVAGIGTSHHMAGLAIERVTGLKFNFIPTKGFGKQVQAVVGGHADAALWPLGEAASQIDNGGVRILALAAEKRSERFPDIPTFHEVGIDIPIWATFRGWAVPAATPDEIIATLSNLMKAVYETPAYIRKMKAAGFIPTFRDAEGFRFVIDNYARLTSISMEQSALAK